MPVRIARSTGKIRTRLLERWHKMYFNQASLSKVNDSVRTSGGVQNDNFCKPYHHQQQKHLQLVAACRCKNTTSGLPGRLRYRFQPFPAPAGTGTRDCHRPYQDSRRMQATPPIQWTRSPTYSTLQISLLDRRQVSRTYRTTPGSGTAATIVLRGL